MHSNARRMLLGLAALSGLSAWSSPGRAQSAPVLLPAGPERPAAEEEVRPNPLLLGSGAATIVASYAPALVVAATSDHKGDKNLFIPVAGPWIDLANRGCGPGETIKCGTTPLEAVGLVGMGLSHAAGVAQLALSFAVPQYRPAVTVGSTRIDVAPTPLAGGFGISAAGRF
jgi:hypothetical protein